MKGIYSLTAIIITFLCLAFFRENNGFVAKRQIPKVGMLTLMHHPALDETYGGYADELAKEDYHNGKNIKIEYQSTNGNQSNLKMMASRLVDDNSTVFFGVTTPAAQASANSTAKTSIVLGAVTDPKTAGLAKSNQHPSDSITGISGQAPTRGQPNLIKQFISRMKILGVICTSNGASAIAGYHQIKRECRKMNINLKAYSIANSSDLNQVSEQMLSQADAVIVPANNTITGATQTLVKNADAANKPVFPTTDTMIKQGGVIAYSVNQRTLDVQGAKMAIAILKGKSKPADTPIECMKYGTPVLNIKQVRKLNLQIPTQLEKNAETKGEVYK